MTNLARYLPGSSSLHSPAPLRASASACPNRFEREGPNSTLTSRSIQTSLTNPGFVQSWRSPKRLAASPGSDGTESLRAAVERTVPLDTARPPLTASLLLAADLPLLLVAPVAVEAAEQIGRASRRRRVSRFVGKATESFVGFRSCRGSGQSSPMRSSGLEPSTPSLTCDVRGDRSLTCATVSACSWLFSGLRRAILCVPLPPRFSKVFPSIRPARSSTCSHPGRRAAQMRPLAARSDGRGKVAPWTRRASKCRS
jgi:hypothetical protein